MGYSLSIEGLRLQSSEGEGLRLQSSEGRHVGSLPAESMPAWPWAWHPVVALEVTEVWVQSLVAWPRIPLYNSLAATSAVSLSSLCLGCLVCKIRMTAPGSH